MTRPRKFLAAAALVLGATSVAASPALADNHAPVPPGAEAVAPADNHAPVPPGAEAVDGK
ncbi:hypothetical protein [Streptomyces sp. NPDC046805]|uniref:hypothetical protein n=1 Tax=Streptomyces sp. NPDC046805 TaxID=3155134 RepID=UPI0033FAAEB5